MRAFGRSRRSWKTPSGLRLAARPPLSSSWREHLRWRHRHTGSRAVSAKGHHSSPPHHHHACARCRVQRTNLDMLHRVRRRASVAIHASRVHREGVRSRKSKVRQKSTCCMPSRNGIRHTGPPDLVQSFPCGAHSAPPAPLRALRAELVGQLGGWDLAAPSLSVTLVAPIQVLWSRYAMHAWPWR